MTYSLYCTDIGGSSKGDSGPMSVLLYKDETDGKVKWSENGERPRVGTAVRVGSLIARSYQHQDWWQTSMIEEILEEGKDFVKFRTRNSTYMWKQF